MQGFFDHHQVAVMRMVVVPLTLCLYNGQLTYEVYVQITLIEMFLPILIFHRCLFIGNVGKHGKIS